MQRYFALKKIDNKIFITPDDEYHIKRVMRMKIDDIIEVVYDDKLYRAIIKSIDDLDIEILEELKQIGDKYPKISLIIPNLKEQKIDLILQKGTEIGVNEFIIVPYERSVVKYDERKEKVKLTRWQKICKEASEQSMRMDIPLINIEKDWKFIDNIEGLRLVCSTNERNNYIKSVLKKSNDYDKITLAIGPEGGITPKEEAYLEEKGFKKITLGTQIMRVETVPIFLTSVIRYEFTE